MRDTRVAVCCVYILVIAFWVAAVMARRICAPHQPTAWLDCPWAEANGWAVGHFVHYAVLGFLMPRWWLVFVSLGVAFELLETALVALQLPGCSEFVRAAVIKDSIVNTIGVLSGMGLRYAVLLA